MEALIGELPDPGTDWPVEKQVAWLDLMGRAFGIVYGGDAAQQMSAPASTQSAKTAPPAKFGTVKKPKTADYDLIIDEGGYVRNAKTSKQLSPSDVEGKTLYDMRGMDGDPKTIIWADGSRGLNGAGVSISAV